MGGAAGCLLKWTDAFLPPSHSVSLYLVQILSWVNLSTRGLNAKLNMIKLKHSKVPKENWKGSSVHTEFTFHQLSPYIGKMKSEMASWLVKNITRKGQTVYDPFCGAGTVALEAAASGRNVISGDLNPLAILLTRAKLFPINNIEAALDKLYQYEPIAIDYSERVDLRTVPTWVRKFFHPETLRETIGWTEILSKRKEYFLLASLLGILHHQRPGFLSFPASHAVPYLRTGLFPVDKYPEYYEYRNVKTRLVKKVERAYKRPPSVFPNLNKICLKRSADTPFSQSVNAIITSPPYMRQLDYARDNRLRLWFLGEEDWVSLDKKISPSEHSFFTLMRECFRVWHNILDEKGTCAIVVGNGRSKEYGEPLWKVLTKIASNEVGGYKLIWQLTDIIPRERRIRRDCKGSETETILLFKRT